MSSSPPHLQLLCPNSQGSTRVSLLQQRSHSERSGLPAMLLHQHMRSQLQLQSPQWLASTASVKVHLRGVGFLIGLTAYSLVIFCFLSTQPMTAQCLTTLPPRNSEKLPSSSIASCLSAVAEAYPPTFKTWPRTFPSYIITLLNSYRYTAEPSCHSEALPHADRAALNDTTPCSIFTAFLQKSIMLRKSPFQVYTSVTGAPKMKP